MASNTTGENPLLHHNTFDTEESTMQDTIVVALGPSMSKLPTGSQGVSTTGTSDEATRGEDSSPGNLETHQDVDFSPAGLSVKTVHHLYLLTNCIIVYRAECEYRTTVPCKGVQMHHRVLYHRV